MGLALKSHLLSGRPHFLIFTFCNFYIARRLTPGLHVPSPPQALPLQEQKTEERGDRTP